LPIQELNETSYKSKNIGVMHACGHDAHTTCVLGAALILNELKTELEGTVHFLFQPGEEKLPGGASKIINEGWLNTLKADTILGQHVEPEMEVGKIGIKSGIFMASADEIYITVKGKGGHGAKPHQCIDPVLVSSHLIVSLQQIVSRNADPLVPSVLTFGKINSNGGATNVIPDSVQIQGTFRTFDENWRKEAHRLITTMTEQLCKSMGAEAEINIMVGYPYLKNDEKITAIVKNRAEEYLGIENVIELPARMGAEDFAFYSQIMPACFYRLGTKNPNGTGLHSATFEIDEKALSVGAGLMAWLAFE
jgi:amidohydrolase